MVKYVPKQGDIIYTDLSETLGHEQKGNKLQGVEGRIKQYVGNYFHDKKL